MICDEQDQVLKLRWQLNVKAFLACFNRSYKTIYRLYFGMLCLELVLHSHSEKLIMLVSRLLLAEENVF